MMFISSPDLVAAEIERRHTGVPDGSARPAYQIRQQVRAVVRRTARSGRSFFGR